jgi:DNA-binding transcriptional MerR regulator
LKIGEFSMAAGISIDTLRYYEKEQLIKVERDASGRRNYKQEDIAWMAFIKRLKETGMPIKQIRVYASLRYQGDSTMPERLALLEEHRMAILDEIARWEASLRCVEEKIGIYKQAIGK